MNKIAPIVNSFAIIFVCFAQYNTIQMIKINEATQELKENCLKSRLDSLEVDRAKMERKLIELRNNMRDLDVIRKSQ